MHDLLEESLLGVDTPDGATTVCLAELLAGLSAGRVDGFTGLRPHQADPWHVFLVQLAASVLARCAPSPQVGEAAFWRDALLELADGQGTAWQLVVDDVTRPAFLQHPLTSASELAQHFKPKALAPDELDVLVTAKDHDVKIARAAADAVEAWLYSLLACQTTSSFLGAGNYGTLRMNGGFASRPVVSMVADRHPSRRFVEDVRRLGEMRDTVVARHGYRQRGITLTWLVPWERARHQFMLGEVEPWFIEAVRCVRLVADGAALVALGATSKERQIGPKSVDAGDVGDPWIPINVEDKKKGRSALTVSATGWSPRQITRLLFQQGFELTSLQLPRAGDGAQWFTGSVVVRGQGTTEGFHRFEVAIPAKARARLLVRESADDLGRFAQELLADASAVERAFDRALMALAEGGPASIDFKNRTVESWAKAVRGQSFQGWQEAYFPTLWRAAEVADSALLRAEWQAQLVTRARHALHSAERSMPLPTSRRYRALVGAEGVLNAALKTAGLIAAVPQPTEDNAA